MGISSSLQKLKNFVGWELYRTWEYSLGLYANISDPYVKKASSRIRVLKGKFYGKRCFIMGNGPSLNQMDLSLLQGEYVWGSNKIYLLFDRINWRPSFYISVDTRVVPDIAVEIADLTSTLPDTLFFFPHHFRVKNILRSGENVYWYREVPLDESDLPGGMFTQDASQWVSSVRTVTVAALQLAVYLGFNPIYLIGCDTTYKIPPTVVKLQDTRDGLISTQDDDPNHFVPGYFGAGSQWHDPHVDRMIFHYEQARRFCEPRGVQIINATLGGNLEVFPRLDYSSLFSGN
jgi:hypothetical protein